MEAAIIESLESRIAPAKISISYTDVDGDIVKITASRSGVVVPTLSAQNLVFTDGDPDGQLLSLTVTDPSFIDASITFTVKKKPGGDGLAHVGFIDATDIDLNKVTVKGDLGRIVAGDFATARDPGLNLLSVRSMGAFGLTTQGGTGDLTTVINGKLGALKVAKDFVEAVVYARAPTEADGEIGSVFIGGDVIGGEVVDVLSFGSGRITSSGAMGNVLVKGDVVSGESTLSGLITSGATMGNVKIGGDLNGRISSNGSMGDVRIAGDVEGRIGSGSEIKSVRIKGNLNADGSATGRISSNTIGSVWIGGDVTAGEEATPGGIFVDNLIDRVQIKGDLAGGIRCIMGSIGQVIIGGDVIGTKSQTGWISGANMAVTIGGDLVGGSITGSESLVDSGAIVGSGIRSVTIKGSIIAGTDESTGLIGRCAGIYSTTDIGTVKIGGSLVGNATVAVLITARGQAVKPASGFDTAIASVSVGGDVEFARILAGFNEFEVPANPDASIGKVTVGRNWEASSLVAGAQDAGAAGYGVGDTLQFIGNTDLIARIGSITIKRSVIGTEADGDHFGFVAQQIDKLTIGKQAFALTPGPSNDDVAIQPDVRLLEVS